MGRSPSGWPPITRARRRARTAGRVHEYVLTRPRDLRRGRDQVAVTWLKRRWKCACQDCRRQTFTESLPAVAARCRLTGRLRELAGAEVAERGCTVAEAARWQQVSWPVAHQAFAAQADPVLEEPLRRVAHLGIDEHRRGRPRIIPSFTSRLSNSRG